MKKIYYICFVVGFCGATAVAVGSEPKGLIRPGADAAKSLEKQVDAALIELKAKKLKCPQIGLLNVVFEEQPYAVVRTKITCAKAARALQEISDLQKKAGPDTKKYFATEAEERLFITRHMKLLVDPVRHFFDLVRDYKTIINPVIAESLGISQQDSSKSRLLKFFESKEEASTFFDHEIKTVEDLKQISLEFIKVFGDVNESLSDRVRKLCDDIVRKMQEAQKQPQATEQKKA